MDREQERMHWITIPEFSENIVSNELKEHPGDLEPEEKKNIHVLARTVILVNDITQPYLFKVTADDYYKLYVNGVYCMQGPAPAYHEHYYYNEINLAPYLKAGKNVIALHLYYQGLVNRVWNSGDNRFAMAAKLKKGDTEYPLTWKYKISKAYSGRTTGYMTQYLEDFDCRLWEENWNTKEETDDSYQSMTDAKWADYRLFLQPTKPVSVSLMKPAVIKKEEDGLFLDAGQEIAGAVCFTVKGKSGSTVRVLCGEELDEEGKVRYQMRCNCCYEETIIADCREVRVEPYDYKAFRYAKLVIDSDVTVSDINFLIRHYPMEDDCCIFKSNNPLLNQIFELCKNGVRMGTQEGYVDCPGREKGQYLGDAIITARSQVWLTGDTKMLRKSIDQFALSSFVNPSLLSIAPGEVKQQIADFSLLWSQLLLTDYEFTGDIDFLKRYYPVARNILLYFSRYEAEDGLLLDVNEMWNLVDWPESMRDGYDFCVNQKQMQSGKHNVINALYLGAIKTLNYIEQLINEPVTFQLSQKIEAFYKVFYHKDKGLFADSEISDHCAIHSNLYVLYFGLAKEKDETIIASYLIKRGIQCGVMASYFLLKGLARAGYYKEVYDMILNKTEYSWYQMLKEGATACQEVWSKEQKKNISLCHPWASAPISILIEELSGFRLDPKEMDGYRFIEHFYSNNEEWSICFLFREQRYEIKQNGKKAVCIKK